MDRHDNKPLSRQRQETCSLKAVSFMHLPHKLGNIISEPRFRGFDHLTLLKSTHIGSLEAHVEALKWLPVSGRGAVEHHQSI
jgi:hypothetical protein